MILFFDTETTGLVNFNLDPKHATQPNLVQLGALLLDEKRRIITEVGCFVKPTWWNPQEVIDGLMAKCMPDDIRAGMIERIQLASIYGIAPEAAADIFGTLCNNARIYVAHNIPFDMSQMETHAFRAGKPAPFLPASRQVDTMKIGTNICKLPGRYPGTYKWPKLQELHKHFFGMEFLDAHDALADVRATVKCYYHMVDNKMLTDGALLT